MNSLKNYRMDYWLRKYDKVGDPKFFGTQKYEVKANVHFPKCITKKRNLARTEHQ